jgi:endoglucanase
MPLVCSGMLHAQHSAEYRLQESWPGGYNADIILQADQSDSALNDWALSWNGSPEVLEAWNCTASKAGDRTILEHASYNETIQPGDSVVLGFTGIGDWPPAPNDVRINGVLIEFRIDGEDGGNDQGGDGDDGGDDGDGHDGGHGDGGGDPTMCCFGDMDGDQIIDGADLSYLLNAWNSADQQADLDGSARVDGADLTLLLTRWGSCHAHHEDPHDHGDFMAITMWGDFHDSNDNSHQEQMIGGRTAITTEAMLAYNDLRAFIGLPPMSFEQVGQWAFDEALTNNSQAWQNDLKGVGLWYAMQGAKVGWITDDAYDPQIIADIQRTARTICNPIEMKSLVMDMVRQHGLEGYAEHLEENGMVDTFINTIKMEPHYGGWMHGRCHGYRSIEGVAINHDVNHLTVLGWDQMDPFMNDTFDWPQWPALNVSDSGVIEYFQSMVILGDPVGDNM